MAMRGHDFTAKFTARFASHCLHYTWQQKTLQRKRNRLFSDSLFNPAIRQWLRYIILLVM